MATGRNLPNTKHVLIYDIDLCALTPRFDKEKSKEINSNPHGISDSLAKHAAKGAFEQYTERGEKSEGTRTPYAFCIALTGRCLNGDTGIYKAPLYLYEYEEVKGVGEDQFHLSDVLTTYVKENFDKAVQRHGGSAKTERVVCKDDEKVKAENVKQSDRCGYSFKHLLTKFDQIMKNNIPIKGNERKNNETKTIESNQNERKENPYTIDFNHIDHTLCSKLAKEYAKTGNTLCTMEEAENGNKLALLKITAEYIAGLDPETNWVLDIADDRLELYEDWQDENDDFPNEELPNDNRGRKFPSNITLRFHKHYPAIGNNMTYEYSIQGTGPIPRWRADEAKASSRFSTASIVVTTTAAAAATGAASTSVMTASPMTTDTAHAAAPLAFPSPALLRASALTRAGDTATPAPSESGSLRSFASGAGHFSALSVPLQPQSPRDEASSWWCCPRRG